MRTRVATERTEKMRKEDIRRGADNASFTAFLAGATTIILLLTSILPSLIHPPSLSLTNVISAVLAAQALTSFLIFFLATSLRDVLEALAETAGAEKDG